MTAPGGAGPHEPGGLVVDTHAHHPGFVPRVPWALYRLVNRRTMPPDADLTTIAAAGVHVVVVCAVGDPLVTRWWRGSGAHAVDAQLDSIERGAGLAGATVVGHAADAAAAAARGELGVVLALEGGDPLAADPAWIDRLAARGLRLLGLVHFADNGLGTICMPWQDLVVKGPWGRRRPTGLTDAGAEVVDRCGPLGVTIDLAHADEQTISDVCQRTARPVVVSHTGARALQDFPRFLTDDAVRMVADTGGYVGLWPFRYRRHGLADLADWTRHAEHLLELVGPRHLAIGTDTNGVPGTMEGYDGIEHLHRLVEAFRSAGLHGADLDLVLGGNALRLLAS